MTILFKHALDLAWNDGRLSRRGAMLLERFQETLELTDKERSEIEEHHSLRQVPYLITRGFGSGADLLDEWIATLLDLDDELPTYLACMGRLALEKGINKEDWIAVYRTAESMGCAFDFARGVWETEFVIDKLDWPDVLNPVADALGLVSEEE